MSAQRKAFTETRLERRLRSLKLHISEVIGSSTLRQTADSEIDLALRIAMEEVRGAYSRALELAQPPAPAGEG